MIRGFIRWTGGPMGTGVSVLNFDSTGGTSEQVEDLALGMDALLSNVMTNLPSSVTAAVVNEFEVRAEDDGHLIGTLTAPVPAGRAGGQASAGYAAGVGARIRWQTSGVRNGRSVIGTTFIIPIANTHFDNLGTLQPNVVTSLTAGANALIGAANAAAAPLGVWSKPTTVGGSDGVIHQVNSATVPDQASWLTSRRH